MAATHVTCHQRACARGGIAIGASHTLFSHAGQGVHAAAPPPPIPPFLETITPTIAAMRLMRSAWPHFESAVYIVVVSCFLVHAQSLHVSLLWTHKHAVAQSGMQACCLSIHTRILPHHSHHHVHLVRSCPTRFNGRLRRWLILSVLNCQHSNSVACARTSPRV